MRKSLFRPILASAGLVTLVGSLGYWLVSGAHRGWSQHRVPVRQIDEVTGVAFTTYENRFVPGIEILATGVALAAGLVAGSFAFPSPSSVTTKS